ncbi:MAG: SBBP repeat-containing protein [Acidobacteriaceae bacterium]
MSVPTIDCASRAHLQKKLGRWHLPALGLLAITCLISGCGSGVYKSGPGTPPSGFTQAASTEQWTAQFGTGNGDIATGVATDPSGNLLVAGVTLGAFPGFSNPNGVIEDFVAKYDSAGHQLWLKQFGTGAANGDNLNAIAIDAQGNVLLGGITSGAYPGYSNPTGAAEAVVFKLDANGNRIWVQQFPAGTGEGIAALAIAPDGSIAAVGAQSVQMQQVSVGMGGTKSEITAEVGLIAKLDDNSGNILWQHTLPQYAIAVLSGVAVDSQGNIYAAGNTLTSYNAPPAPLLLQYSPAGAAGWVQQLQSTSYASGVYLSGVAVGTTGDPVVVGCPIENAVSPAPGCLLAEYGSGTGQQAWLTPFAPSAAFQIGSGGIAVDPSGNILITGYTQQPLLPTFNLQDDVYIAKFQGTGQNIWAQQFNDQAKSDHGSVGGPSLTVDGQGNSYIGDNTFTQPSTPTGASFSEPLLAKFGP